MSWMSIEIKISNNYILNYNDHLQVECLLKLK